MFASFSAVDMLVAVAGIATIVWINWYFFFAQAPAAAVVGGARGTSEVVIVVSGGYVPATVHVKAGEAVRLVFDRRETNSCSEEIVIPDFGVRRFLPAFQKTTVEITPPDPGTYEFTCGMSMLRGRVVAE